MVGWNFITIANREHIEGEQKHKVFQRLHVIAAKTEPVGVSSLGVPGVPWYTQILADQLTYVN